MIRMSSSVLYQKSIQDMQGQQLAIAKLQSQISSNRKVLNPSDDPVAASREVGLDASRMFTEQMLRNQGDVDGRLTQYSSYIEQSKDILQAFRTRVVNGNTASVSANDRQSLANELQAMRDQLFAIANTRDSNNHYIFSGYKADTVAFINVNGQAIYNGDDGVREVQVTSNLNMATNITGQALFTGIPAGDGTIYTTANTNSQGAVFTASANAATFNPWNTPSRAPLTIEFTPANDGTFEVRDNTNAVFFTGTIPESGGTVVVDDGGSPIGLSVTFSERPAAGDRYTIQSSTNTEFNIFDIMDKAIAALRFPDSSTESADRANILLQSLNMLDGAMDRFIEFDSLMGARLVQLGALKVQDTANKDNFISETVRLTGMTPEDQVAAISELTLRNISLEAGRQLYGTISRNSLFNYI